MAATVRMNALFVGLAICLLCCSSTGGQQYHIPANNEAHEAAHEAIDGGTLALSYAGGPNATLAGLATLFAGAHEGAEQSYITAYAGQRSGTYAAVAAAGASLYAATSVINNDTSSRPAVQAALNAASSLINAIVDENAVQNSNETNANLLLLYQIGHDGTLAQYYQNLTGGQANDNETFAETAEFVSDEDNLAAAAETYLERGASPALAAIAGEVLARNALAAIHVYRGEAAQAYQQGLAEARLILKAVNVLQNGASCGNADVSGYLSQVNSAVEALTKAAESLSSSDIDAAQMAAQNVVMTPSCASVAPAISPSASTASLGRRLL